MFDPEITQVLHAVSAGEPGAEERLAGLVYDDLHELAVRYMQRESVGHTLQPTVLVHEAFLRVVDQRQVTWRSRSHFFAVGAQAMRRILVDHARRRQQIKRGGGWVRVPLSPELALSTRSDLDVLAVNKALERLEDLDPDRARIVELRFFGGLTLEEAAEVMGVSKRTVQRHWRVCRAWLRRELAVESAGG